MADATSFAVRVRDNKGETTHQVTLSDSWHLKLAGEGQGPKDVVRAAFRFLLDRETKESILARFDLADIARYFAEFERAIANYF
ncbi:MAG: hypothetical protein JOZ55_03245 [Alphaproteobacteria bacterium]|nr:hypothetical protein [Alphaproteobacteria bacterium]